MSKIKCPSKHDKGPEQRRIGHWFADQRKAYKYKKLSKERIKKLESLPRWSWEPIKERLNKNKNKLIEMAQNKEPRPNNKTKLGMSFAGYIREASDTFDLEFNEKIRGLAPQWFIDSVAENIKTLLAIARNKDPRPPSRTKIGSALGRYRWRSRRQHI